MSATLITDKELLTTIDEYLNNISPKERIELLWRIRCLGYCSDCGYTIKSCVCPKWRFI